MDATKKTDDVKEFTELYTKLPQEQKTAVLHYMQGMKAQAAIDAAPEPPTEPDRKEA